MRSRLDEGSERRGKDKTRVRRKAKSPKGGKALQRLLNYLSERDPLLVADVVGPIGLPKAAQPKVAPAPSVGRARPAPAARARASRTSRPAARSLAAAMTRATRKIARPSRRTKKAGRRRGSNLISRVNSSAWLDIGPSLVPEGQTYGTNRVDVIGRVSSVAVDPGNVKHLLCGSANGGIWETKDGGATWAARTDQMPTLAIGAVTFDPGDRKRVYAGSGEGNFYANLGAGVYRSVDGGTTWKVIATAPFVGVGFYDLVVDPVNTKVLYAATTVGFYVSTNSGVNWSLKRAGRCWDITVHPGGGTVELLAAFVDGLFVSSNAGSSFTPVALPSPPAAAWDRLAVDRVQAAPAIAYVFGAAGGTPHLWRRTGSTWSKVTGLPALSVNQAWYDWYVAASPTNRGRVFLGAIDTFRGDLSGTTWTWTNITSQGNNSIHPDQHSLTFAPGNANVIYAGNDGGVYRSATSGNTWKALNRGLGITEVEYLGSDPTTWQWLMAGTQDNGTIRFTGSTIWEHIADGDGGDCGVNQLNPNEVYHSYYNVSLEGSNNKGDTWTWLAPPAVPSLFYPPVEVSGATVAIGGVSFVVTRTGGPPWTHRLARPAVRRRRLGDARHRRQHLPGRHDQGPDAARELERLELDRQEPHLTGAALHQLRRHRSEQPAAHLGHVVAARRRTSVSIGRRGRVVDGLHGEPAVDSNQFGRRRSSQLPAGLGVGRRWRVRIARPRRELVALLRRPPECDGGRPVVSQAGSSPLLRHAQSRRLGYPRSVTLPEHATSVNSHTQGRQTERMTLWISSSGSLASPRTPAPAQLKQRS